MNGVGFFPLLDYRPTNFTNSLYPHLVEASGGTGLKLVEAHRRHCGTQKRDARRELSLNEPGLMNVNSGSIADFLSSSVTSVSDAAMRAELTAQLTVELDEMDSVEREVIVLHHFERLTMEEIGQVLSMSSSAVGRCYLRALKNLRTRLPFLPE